MFRMRFLTRVRRELDQAQHRRVRRVVKIGGLFVGAIDGERVLSQVVVPMAKKHASPPVRIEGPSSGATMAERLPGT